MINKDYILRLAERLGRYLAILMRLREFNKHEEALIYIDDLLLQMVGLTSRFINSLSEDMLVKSLSPLGTLNNEACLWAASLLKVEGEVYEDMGNATESYYRYLKSLHLYLEVLAHETITADSGFYIAVNELIDKLADYELPYNTKSLLFAYFEHTGMYGKAEDILFELLESKPPDQILAQQGRDFYTRLLKKSDMDLQAGNLSRQEVEEGLNELQHNT